ncbi:sulfur carrier protein ThiS [Aliirhizobium cellulosilyticum]|uniref:Sulfur carrier protein n=1 Tax=Aliirhizobium cellulosilyticum TaxID=393664 RepID=A0A7W6WR34_9HYPH|nr:sulfur carrier protein ThiS [Rhizobium cellulosilyticum]MBB4350027.1 sulfur carrier protein [Rhizobium cellulosilyticum]MBB4413206.1 sulfur carrier protein [Rhizobium cellulosilyticum]MBB4447856.1 sulfur carrier protein [Rhizobium cellulosilyticum]
MNLIVNGERQFLQACTLADLLMTLEYEGDWLATAINGDLVHREDRADARLAEGDRIEILSPMQGG